MMLIPQHIGLGATETHKSSYFVEPSSSPPSVLATVSSGAPAVNGPQSIFSYPAGDGCFVPSRMQPEIPGLNVYTPQPGSSALASPGNYGPVPGQVATAPGLMTPHYGPAGIEHSPYYPSLGSSYDLKPGAGEMWTGGYPQPPPGYYPYDNNFGPQYPYDRYCTMDMNDGVRRKNATRESTNTLKAWLQEHKKNPYPTKGEKIMLAIITKMTLTQVSTWFANARRRLKKENKMTWIPKNRSNESATANDKKDDDDDDDDDASQHQDADLKSEADRAGDSDDSAEREETSANDSAAFNQSERFDSEHREFLASDGDKHRIEEEKVHHPAVGEGGYGEIPCDPARPNYGPSDAPNRAIWSPANESQPGAAFKQERLDASREDDNGSYNPHYIAEQYSSLHRHHPSAVSPPLARDASDPSVPPQFHYPHAQPWNDNVFHPSLPLASEVPCHTGTSLESVEGRSDAAGTPPSGDYNPRPIATNGAYQRQSQSIEHFMPPGAYSAPPPHVAEIPVQSPHPPSALRPIDSTPPYQMYGHNVSSEYYPRSLPPITTEYSSSFYQQREASHLVPPSEGLQPYPHNDMVPVDPGASPSSATITPPSSRFQQQQRNTHVAGAVSYYGQTPLALVTSNISPSSYSSHYYPQDGSGSDLRPRHLPINRAASLGDVKQPLATTLSPSVNKGHFARSPETAVTNVDVGMSPSSHVCKSERRDGTSS